MTPVGANNRWKVSVTQLANFACRGGDLLPDSVAGPTALQGMRAHKKLQAELLADMPADGALMAEVSLSCISEIDGHEITLRGRIDLVDHFKPCLSEIKSTFVASDKLPESQVELQWAQLYLYGYVYLKNDFPEDVADPTLELELIHVNLRNGERFSDRRTVSGIELREHGERALRIYIQWIVKIENYRQKMVDTAAELEFPFSAFRSGQRDMAAAVYRSCRDGTTVLCEAPTGIGKTVSSLYPAFKSMAEGHVNQLAYLTAKVAGRLTAQMTLDKLRNAGLAVTSIQLRSKHPTCFCSNGRCERDDRGRCPMTLGFFDRLAEARAELLQKGVITGELMDEVAWQYQLCPFELSQQLLPWVQVIIADYNYVFDPLVRLPHFSIPAKKTLLLVDEAHNLLDRSRSMFSGVLSRIQCLEEAELCQPTHQLLANSLMELDKQLMKYSRMHKTSCDVTQNLDKNIKRAVTAALDNLMGAMGELPPLPDSSGELFKALCRFSVIADLAAENHRCITRTERVRGRKEVTITLFCVDASADLARVYKLFRAQILFSATLRPATFYRDTLGLPESCGYLQLASPFRSENAYRAVVSWVDTRYKQRHSSIGALVDLIYLSTSCRQGNYLVFFPSYAYLRQVHDAFTARFGHIETWTQDREQTKEEHAQLLAGLDLAGHRIGFAILGGVFGEGIDYLGQRLIGVLVISTGLPGLDKETELVGKHYQSIGRSGYDFAYRYPGFTRVLQTAGRLIRHENDRGFVLLVDARFASSGYRQLYPKDWQVSYPEDEIELKSAITRFWLKD